MSIKNIHVSGVYADLSVEVEDDGYVTLKIDDDRDYTFLSPEEAQELVEAISPKTAKRALKIEAAPEKPAPVPQSQVEQSLRSYLNLKVPVLLDYRKANGTRIERTVSPAAIERGAVPGSRMLVGFDHARGRVGNFRLDRVLGICPAPVEFESAD